MTIGKSVSSLGSGQSTSSDAGDICFDKPLSRTWLAAVSVNALFLILILINVIRTLRHAMWRDEMGTFQTAAASASLWELLSKLEYAIHPGLWYSLVWLVTRFTSDPMSMAIMHTMIAIAAWTVIFRWSPFATVEKFLCCSAILCFGSILSSAAVMLLSL